MMMMTKTATTPRGWRHALTGSSRVRLEAASTPSGRRFQRRVRAGLSALGPTPLLRPWLVKSRRALPRRPGGGHARPQATGPLTRGHAAASEKGEAAAGAPVLIPVKRELLRQGQRLSSRGLEP